MLRLVPTCPVVLATRVDLHRGGWTRAAVERGIRTGTLVRVRRGVYANAPLPARGTHLLSGGEPDPGYVAQVRAVLLSLGATAAAGHRTAAVLWRFDMLIEPDEIQVFLPVGRSHVALTGVAVSLRRGAEVTTRTLLGHPLRLTTAVDTVLDCAATLPLREAVVIADSALRSRRVTIDDLLDGAARRRGHPGVRRIRQVLAVVDPQSGSVLESALRVLLLRHGLVPDSQVELRRRDGRWLGRVDFAFIIERLVVECDGRRWHDPQDARDRDRRRDNELERAGWRLLRFSWDDVLHHSDAVVEMIVDCLQPLAA